MLRKQKAKSICCCKKLLHLLCELARTLAGLGAIFPGNNTPSGYVTWSSHALLACFCLLPWKVNKPEKNIFTMKYTQNIVLDSLNKCETQQWFRQSTLNQKKRWEWWETAGLSFNTATANMLESQCFLPDVWQVKIQQVPFWNDYQFRALLCVTLMFCKP